MVFLSSDLQAIIRYIQYFIWSSSTSLPIKDHLPSTAIYGNYFYYDTEEVQKIIDTGEHSRQISQ
ncbi:hypothetical protein GCM10008915_46240 [Bifidobacterium pullorum subsp. gallinarum]